MPSNFNPYPYLVNARHSFITGLYSLFLLSWGLPGITFLSPNLSVWGRNMREKSMHNWLQIIVLALGCLVSEKQDSEALNLKC